MTSRIKPCFMVAGLSLCFCVSALASVNCQTQCAQIRYPDRNVVDKMVKKKCYYRPRGVEVVYPGLAYSSHGLDDGSNEAYNKCKDKDRICIETGAAGFDDLSIFDTGPDILVTFGDVEILILDERRGRIDEDDFIF